MSRGSVLEGVYRHALRLCASEVLTEVGLHLDPGVGRIEIRRPVLEGDAFVAGELLASVPRPRTEIAVIAAGKAALGQATALTAQLPIAAGLVVTPPGLAGIAPPGWVHIEAAHPIPDARSVAAGARALEIARGLGAGDLLICAVSGGTSALLALPAPGVSLADEIAVTRLLLRSGAAIDEINAVRQRLSAIKGGRLAAASAAAVLCIGLSDVPGDRLEDIGSGPAWPAAADGAKALEVVERHGLGPALPPAVQRILTTTSAFAWPRDRPRPTGAVLAGPAHLRAAAKVAARAAGYRPLVDDAHLVGSVTGIAKMIADRAAERRHERTCFIWVGEPSVVVPASASGQGGRDSHLALLVAERLRGAAGVSFLACGSDGIDGDSDAAGAVVDATTWDQAVAAGCDPADALARYDSATVHRATGAAVVTGPTGTNFTDLFLLATGG